MEDEAFQELLEIQEALNNEDITIKHEGHWSLGQKHLPVHIVIRYFTIEVHTQTI